MMWIKGVKRFEEQLVTSCDHLRENVLLLFPNRAARSSLVRSSSYIHSIIVFGHMTASKALLLLVLHLDVIRVVLFTRNRVDLEVEHLLRLTSVLRLVALHRALKRSVMQKVKDNR